MFIRVVEIVGFALLAIILVTQLILPLLLGHRLFPLFRSKVQKLEKQLNELQADQAEEKLKEEIRRTKHRPLKPRRKYK